MGDEVQRLVTVLDANISKMEAVLKKANAAHYGAAAKIEKRWAENDNKLQKLWGNPVKALDEIFDNSRLRVLDSGAARIGLVGTALEHLGPAGLGAAGAIAAVTLAFAGSREAARFADGIADAAKAAHVTTDALQELRFAIRQTGGEEKGADEALQSFSATLGKAQEGMPKAQKAFLALGFSKAQIMGWRDAETALADVHKAINGLGKDHQKDAVISQLGLGGLKQVLEGSTDELQRLRAEARSLGIVMDAELVQRGGELNDQFETVAKVIEVQWKSALVDVGPALLDLLRMMASMVEKAADFADIFKSIEHRRTTKLQDDRNKLLDEIDRLQKVGGPVARNLVAVKRQKLTETDAELAQRAVANDVRPSISNGRDLVPQGPAPHSSGPSPESQLKRFHQMLARQASDLNDAHDSERRAAEERAGFAEERLRLEREARDIELKDLVQTKAITAGQAAIVAAGDQELFAAKKALLATEIREALVDEQLRGDQALADATTETAGLAQSAARTQEERRAIALRILEAERKIERGALEEAITRDPALRPNRDLLLGEFDRQTGLQQAATRRDNAGPMAAWIDKAPKSIAELNEAFQQMEVEGISSLSSGLADAIANAKDLGDVGAQVFKQLEVQILTMLIQAGASKALAFLGLGFADGGPVRGPGGSREDAIPAWLSNGEFVINAQAAAKHRGLLEAINNGKAPHFANGGAVGTFHALQGVRGLPTAAPRGVGVTQQLFADFSGAVVTEDLMRQFQTYADRKATEAAYLGRDMGHNKTMARLQTRAANALGRR